MLVKNIRQRTQDLQNSKLVGLTRSAPNEPGATAAPRAGARVLAQAATYLPPFSVAGPIPFLKSAALMSSFRMRSCSVGLDISRSRAARAMFHRPEA